MKIPHLIQYQGSKRNLAPRIISYLPRRFSRLIEPFAGTAAITLACAVHNKAQEYVINDLNKPMVDLFKMVVSNPELVYARYKEVWDEQHIDSIEHYYQIRKEFNGTQKPVYFLYLLARCVKGAVRYNSDGLFNQSPDKRRKGTNPSKMRDNIFEISAALKGNGTTTLNGGQG